MPRNYWMVVQTPENFQISKEMGFAIHGVRYKHRRRAQRMEPNDRMLFYVSGIRQWTATASVTSRYFEDRKPIWRSAGRGRPEQFPFRVELSPDLVLDEAEYIDALALAPRLDYLKRWPPERWPLAFIDSLHLLPQRDFRLVEAEMKRALSQRKKSAERQPSEDGEGEAESNGSGEPTDEAGEVPPYSAADGSAAAST